MIALATPSVTAEETRAEVLADPFACLLLDTLPGQATSAHEESRQEQ